VFRHHDIPDDYEAVPLARLFQNREEGIPAARGAQKGQSPVARSSDKVQVMSAVGAMQSAGPDRPHGTGSIVPALAKNARTGNPQFRNGKREHGRLGHPPKVYMTGGTTPYYAYWPTPGNGTAEVNGNAVTFYYMHKDWVGNSRISSVIVNPFVVSDQAYAPYGEVYNKLATGAGVPAQMFTGDTQHILTGIFDTPNRELNASQGRWLSPDPAGAGWNQYAYATNPNSFIDPSGLNRALPGQCQEGNGMCADEGAGMDPSSIDNSGGGFSYDASYGSNGNDPSSDCPICTGPYGSFGTAGIAGGWLTAGSIYGPPEGADPGSIANQFTTGPIPGGTDDDPLWFIHVSVFDTFGPQGNLDLIPFGSSGPGQQSANNCQAPFLCNPVGQIGPPPQHKPPPSSFMSKWGAQVACEFSVGIALWSDQQEDVLGAAFGLLAGYFKGNVIAATGGLMLAARVTVVDALQARSICVPLAWGPGYF